MNVSKVVISKGASIENPRGKWKRVQFTVELELTEKDDPELAKSLADTLLDTWLEKEKGDKEI